MHRAEAFLTHRLSAYADARDRPAGDGTSMLSPHLHFGEISPSSSGTCAHRQPERPRPRDLHPRTAVAGILRQPAVAQPRTAGDAAEARIRRTCPGATTSPP